VLIAAVPTVAPEDEAALRPAATTLAGALDRRRAPLAVARHGEIVIVKALSPSERPSLRAPLEKACQRVASRGMELAVGVSTAQEVATLGNAYREASLALGRLGPRGGVLSLPDLSAFEYLMLRGDQVAQRLIAPEIERFVIEDRDQGGQLTRTLLAYAEADLNAKAAAEALLIHVNTAHYRLARIAEKTGCDLRRLPDVIDLVIAIRLNEGQPRQ
jgi:sugar diacid utilization regulator